MNISQQCLNQCLRYKRLKIQNIIQEIKQQLIKSAFDLDNQIIKRKRKDQMNIQSGQTGKKIQNYIFNYWDFLGAGNFSKCYKGYNQITKQVVAIKIVELNSLKSKKLSELLFQQIQILKKLNHQSVLKCFQIFSSNRNCYIITELCNEGNLQNKLKLKKKLSENQANPIIKDVYDGLIYLAQNNIVHRDLKSANIFLHNGRAKIADFGFAKQISHNFKDLNIGSPLYMAPEGILHNIYGPKTQVWALGILVYQIFHGSSPYIYCKTEQDLRRNIMIPLQWNQLRADLAQDIKQFILVCLEVNEQKRSGIQQLKDLSYMKRLHVNTVQGRSGRQGIKSLYLGRQQVNVRQGQRKNSNVLLLANYQNRQKLVDGRQYQNIQSRETSMDGRQRQIVFKSVNGRQKSVDGSLRIQSPKRKNLVIGGKGSNEQRLLTNSLNQSIPVMLSNTNSESLPNNRNKLNVQIVQNTNLYSKPNFYTNNQIQFPTSLPNSFPQQNFNQNTLHSHQQFFSTSNPSTRTNNHHLNPFHSLNPFQTQLHHPNSYQSVTLSQNKKRPTSHQTNSISNQFQQQASNQQRTSNQQQTSNQHPFNKLSNHPNYQYQQKIFCFTDKITFKEAIFFIHYCRLLFKFLCFFKQSSFFQQQNYLKIFRHLMTLLNAINKICQDDRLTVQGQKSQIKIKKFKQVTLEYLTKYKKELQSNNYHIQPQLMNSIFFFQILQMIKQLSNKFNDQIVRVSKNNFRNSIQQNLIVLSYLCLVTIISLGQIQTAIVSSSLKILNQFKQIQIVLNTPKDEFTIQNYMIYKEKFNI